jgi:hypothetical protein
MDPRGNIFDLDHLKDARPVSVLIELRGAKGSSA